MNARLDGKHIRIYDAFMIKESIKEIPGRFYDADDKAWVVPFSSENVSLLGLLGVALDDAEEKIVTVAEGFTLKTGAFLAVKFTNSNSVSMPRIIWCDDTAD